jgi:hypothetical protein
MHDDSSQWLRAPKSKTRYLLDSGWIRFIGPWLAYDSMRKMQTRT